jgi:hypothetical protein
MLQNVEEANDRAQGVVVRAWRAMDRAEDREAARPWLVIIAIRLGRICGWSLSTAKRRLQAAETRVFAKLNALPHHARSQP